MAKETVRGGQESGYRLRRIGGAGEVEVDGQSLIEMSCADGQPAAGQPRSQLAGGTNQGLELGAAVVSLPLGLIQDSQGALFMRPSPNRLPSAAASRFQPTWRGYSCAAWRKSRPTGPAMRLPGN